MPRCRTLLAALALFGMIASSLYGAVVAAHVFLTDHAERHHAAEEEAPLHGHSHGEDEPAHEHALSSPHPSIKVGPPALASDALPAVLLPTPATPSPVVSAPASRRADRWGPESPPPSLFSTVLRI